jgi:hypothetical protein
VKNKPTVKCSVLRHTCRVFRIERGDGRRVLPVECLVMLHSQRTNLLGYLWNDRVFLFGEPSPRRQSLADTLSRLCG